LSELETYRVYAGLLALQQAKKLSQVRFFGKVLGTGADYYVAEAKYESPPDPPEGDPPPPPPGAPVEESGTGSNEFVYFVANDPAAAWTVLPDVTPHAIVSSRPIYKFLTGDLSAEVRAYPPFPGKENEYLRALIARIVHGTTLTAVNKFKMPEEYEPGAMPAQNEDEDYKPTPTAKLGDVKGWCTRYYGLLQIGRTVNPPPPEEELAEGEVSKLPKPEPELKPLSPIDASAWMVTTYTHGGPAVAVARSLKWPGAYNAYQLVGKKDTVAQVYVGFGLEALDAPFKMQPPPPFQYEPAELEEQLDTPLDEENAAFVKLAMAALAEEAAAMPDPAE
jgi:radial spoke head protein 4A